MKEIVRRIAVVMGAVAMSAGLMAATAVPAHADDDTPPAARDSSWPR
jgi:hypothetical protein